MATLIQRSSGKCRSRISIRYGAAKENKSRVVYVDLGTDDKNQGFKRNNAVTLKEQTIRKRIRQGDATESELLNLPGSVDWSWIKKDGTDSTFKVLRVRECAKEFIEACEIKGLRQNTIEYYTNGLSRFADAYSGDVSEIDYAIIMKFKKYIKNRDTIKSLSSEVANLKCLRAFLHWCVKMKYLDSVPPLEIPTIDPNPKWINEAEFKMLMKYKGYSNARFPEVFRLYFDTGLRLEEGFKGYIEGDRFVIPEQVSKNKKERKIPITDAQKETIEMMQRIYRDMGSKDSHIQHYSRTFRNVCDALKIDSDKHFHCLRHSYGKRMTMRYQGLYKEIATLMGHHSFTITEKYYAQNTNQDDDNADFPSLAKYNKVHNLDSMGLSS